MRTQAQRHMRVHTSSESGRQLQFSLSKDVLLLFRVLGGIGTAVSHKDPEFPATALVSRTPIMCHPSVSSEQRS